MFISFMQNDDWIYYKTVESFLRGDFSLNSLVAPTFYVQGLLAYLFAKLFGLYSLPILTLIISISTYLVFVAILNKFYLKNIFWGFVVGLLLLFNPWFSYSSIGFMTENYLLFFLLVATYAFHLYEQEKNNNPKVLLTLCVSLIAAFFVKQAALVFIVALAIFYMFKRDYKNCFLFTSLFLTLYGYYMWLFPRTAEMFEKPLQTAHLFDRDYSFALVYGSLIVIYALLMPLIIAFILNTYTKLSKRNIVLIVVCGIMCLYFLNSQFQPMKVSWGEFPYFENIWERTGLYPRGVIGTKYQFRWNYDLYRYWDQMSKILISLSLPAIAVVIYKRRYIDFNIIFVTLYLGLMILSETFYDRYLLTIIPFAILFFIKSIELSKINKLLICTFIAFIGFFTYQMTMDFVLVNKYIWNKSVQTVNNERINPVLVLGTNAWKLNYKNEERKYLYEFSYDSPEVNGRYKDKYLLLEEKIIEYPFNIYINPKVYFYKRIAAY